MPWRRHVDGTRTSRQFQRETWTILGKKKEKLNVQVCPPFLPPSSLCRASSDIISSSQIRSILFTLPLSLSISLSLSLSFDPLENFFHEISSKKWIRCQRRVARILVIPMSSRVHFAVELSQAIRPSREMARSSVECILIMVNSCNAQPCRRECELFASGSEMYPVQKYHFHRANSFPTRDRNHATREQFLEITILQITTLSTCISPIWKCITNDNTTRILFHTPPRNFFNAR